MRYTPKAILIGLRHVVHGVPFLVTVLGAPLACCLAIEKILGACKLHLRGYENSCIDTVCTN